MKVEDGQGQPDPGQDARRPCEPLLLNALSMALEEVARRSELQAGEVANKPQPRSDQCRRC